jgi:AraC family transcriptional activator of pobA
VEGYIVHFNESLIGNFLQNGNYLERFSFFRGTAAAGVRQIAPGDQGKVKEVFEEMLQEVSSAKGWYLDMVRIKLMELFIIVERSDRSRETKAIPSHKLTLLRNFQQLIDQYFRTIKLPKEYADLLYVTPNHLNALCNELLGRTAGDLIRERILVEAKRLLTNADMTVTEIAFDLNFQDNSYFNRFFRKYVKMTPDEFRKKFIDR